MQRGEMLEFIDKDNKDIPELILPEMAIMEFSKNNYYYPLSKTECFRHINDITYLFGQPEIFRSELSAFNLYSYYLINLEGLQSKKTKFKRYLLEIQCNKKDSILFISLLGGIEQIMHVEI